MSTMIALLFQPYKEQCYDQGLNSGYGRLDSTFGPAAMSYRPIGSSTVDANCITNKETTLANHLVSDFNGHNDNYGKFNLIT